MSEPSVVFSDLIDQMQKAELSAANRPTILGGQFDAARLTAFLTAWRVRWEEMPWRIWEHVSEIEFAAEPKEPELLQRGEVFGEDGHLSLRRDGGRWLWRYIGPAGQPAPAGFECADFWTTGSGQSGTLRRYDERALLWGQKVTDQQKQPSGPSWWEDRLAAARLDYPERLKGHKHVYLKFWRFTEAGRTVFVWYRELE